MSTLIRVVNRKPLPSLTEATLRAGIVERLPRTAAAYGEEGSSAAASTLTVERVSGTSTLDAFEVRWSKEHARGLRVERWADDRVSRELGALREWLDGYLAEESDDDGADEIADALDGAEEAIGLELDDGDTEGMGWPIAMAAASFLAERGDGVVRADGEGWLAPDDGELSHLLEAD